MRVHRFEREMGELPRRFTYPHYYVPHPLVVDAARMVEKHLDDRVAAGKMFGVLICEDGFLAAYSGEIAELRGDDYFVPPIVDYSREDGYFRREEREIVGINEKIKRGEGDVEALRRERKERSQALQNWLFGEYEILNGLGERKSLLDIFAEQGLGLPPSATGDCAGPRLLQYAYENGIRPLAMGEFWVGASPKNELRRNGYFYPACNHKCKPLLNYMLRGLEVEDNPLDKQPTVEALRVVFEDQWILAVDKPSGMLSVPGRQTEYCAEKLLREARGELFAVHRLDQATSGVLLFAKDFETYRAMQRLFELREVKKTYVALLEGRPKHDSGVVELPICLDVEDRPRQMVSEEYGKAARTRYRVMEVREDGCVVEFQPETGRTHQLRVHAAHASGLDAPIVGDALYGNAGERLMLHAASVRFRHPVTGEIVLVRAEVPFL